MWGIEAVLSAARPFFGQPRHAISLRRTKYQSSPFLGDDISGSRARLDLRRGWRVDDRCTDQGARPQRDAPLGQVRVDVREDRPGQPVPLRQVAEVQDRGLVGDAAAPGFDPGKAADRRAVVERLLGHRVARRMPVLQETDPQHRLQRQRRPPALGAGLRILRLDQSHKTTPRRHPIHLRQEQLTPRGFLLPRVAKAGKSGCFGIGRAPRRVAQAYQITPKAAGSSDVP